MGAHAYHLGNRAKYYIKDCTGLCSMCKHRVDYQHLFTWCPGISTFRVQWEQEKPIRWVSEPADWLGFPSTRYDTLPLGEKKQVLQWLIQAAEIRRDALFNYIQYVYKGHHRKLEIHHTVRARIAYTGSSNTQAHKEINSQQIIDPTTSLMRKMEGLQVTESRPQGPAQRTGGDGRDLKEMDLDETREDTDADRNAFVNEWFAEEPCLAPAHSQGVTPLPIYSTNNQNTRPHIQSQGGARRRDDLLCGLDAVNNILRHMHRQCIQRESIDEVMSHLAREEALLLQGGEAVDNAPDRRGNYSVDALQLVLRVYADAEVSRWTRGQQIQDSIYLLGNGYHWTVVVYGPHQRWWHWDGNHSSCVAIDSFLNWTGHAAVLAVKRQT